MIKWEKEEQYLLFIHPLVKERIKKFPPSNSLERRQLVKCNLLLVKTQLLSIINIQDTLKKSRGLVEWKVQLLFH